MKLFLDIVMKRIYLFNIVFPVCKKGNFAGLQAHRKRGKSARASPTPHHTLNEERTARFIAQHQPPPPFFAWQRRARNASDWWWTARDHGKGTDGKHIEERRLGTRQAQHLSALIFIEWFMAHRINLHLVKTTRGSRDGSARQDYKLARKNC